MNGDLISRSALLDYFDAKAFNALELWDGGATRETWLEAFEVVRNAPAVDAEPVKHGRWDSFGVRKTDAKGRNRIEYMFNACTLCENPAVKRTAYCPNCGAQMDAEANDVD